MWLLSVHEATLLASRVIRNDSGSLTDLPPIDGIVVSSSVTASLVQFNEFLLFISKKGKKKLSHESRFTILSIKKT